MPDGRRVYALLSIFLTTFFWGISYSSTKLLLGSLTPAQIVFFPLGIGGDDHSRGFFWLSSEAGPR